MMAAEDAGQNGQIDRRIWRRPGSRAGRRPPLCAYGYTVILVAGREALERLAQELGSKGATALVIAADLADTAAVPLLAAQVRALAGSPDAFYYAPTPSGGFILPAA